MAALRRVEFWGLPAALMALGVARLLPNDSVSIYLKLLTATIVFFYPGYLTAIALGRRSFSAILAASLGLLAACMGVMFVVHGSLALALWLYAGCGLVALAFAWIFAWRGREAPTRTKGTIWVILAGIGLGILLWRVAGVLHGDQLFHLARARKLLELNDLSLGSLNEFADGSLHPGYAYPLWHGLLAGISRLAGVDPSLVVLHEPSVLAPAALLIAYEAGWEVFQSLRLAACALIAQAAFVVVAPGHGGTYAWLTLPGTVGRHLLVPAVIALFFAQLNRAAWPGLILAAMASLSLAMVHVTYVIYALVILGAFLVARRLVTGSDFGEGVRAFSAVSMPALAFMAALSPIVGTSTSYDPTTREVDRALEHYGSQIATYAGGRYALAPEVLVRWGAISVAAVALTALAFVAAKKRWSALVLGGGLAVLMLTLLPWIFMPLSDLVSISQARRLALFYPFAFAFAGGLGIVAGLLRRYTLALALAAGTALQLAWPGDFGYRLHSGGGPGWLVWGAFAAIALALICFFLSPEADFDEGGDSTVVYSAALFTLPIVLAGLFYWTPVATSDRAALTPGITEAIRREVPDRAVVLAAPDTGYRILAIAPVYVTTAPPGHVADTEKNRPYGRRRDYWRFLATGDLKEVARYEPDWMIIERSKAPRLARGLKPVFRDRRFALYRIPAEKIRAAQRESGAAPRG